MAVVTGAKSDKERGDEAKKLSTWLHGFEPRYCSPKGRPSVLPKCSVAMKVRPAGRPGHDQMRLPRNSKNGYRPASSIPARFLHR